MSKSNETEKSALHFHADHGHAAAPAPSARHVCWLPDVEKAYGACCAIDPGPDPTYIPDPIPPEDVADPWMLLR